jgi:hypothetical protein
MGMYRANDIFIRANDIFIGIKKTRIYFLFLLQKSAEESDGLVIGVKYSAPVIPG